MKSKEFLAIQAYPPILEEDGWDRNEQYREAWLEGYEKAEQKLHLIELMRLDEQIPKWKTIEEYTPEEDTQILCYLLNKWAKEVSRYSVLRYFQGNWYGDITEDETVEKWMEIPQ